MRVPDDSELLEAWRNGDADAANELFERYFEAVYAFFRSKVDGDVEDLIQRTFLGCIEGKTRVRAAASFRAYLFAIARHELYDHFEQLRLAQRRPITGVTSVHDLMPSPSRVAAEREESRILLEGLRRLPIDLQIVLELHYFEQLSSRELALVLGIPDGTVRSRLRRARSLLAQRVGELDSDNGAAGTDPLENWAESLRADLAPKKKSTPA